MTILYGAIGRDTDGQVLAESQKTKSSKSSSSGQSFDDQDSGLHAKNYLDGGNYHEVASQLLAKLASNPSCLPSVGSRRTFVHRANVESSKGSGDVEEGGMIGNFDLGDWFGCGTGDYSGGGGSSPYWAMGAGGEGGAGGGGGGGDQLDHYFHVLRGEGAYYAALSDDQPGRPHSINFAFLDELQKEFAYKHPPAKIAKAKAGSFTKSFLRTFQNLLHRYNTERKEITTDPKVAKLNAQVEDLKSVMGNNIALALKRSKHLDALVEESDQLEHDAHVFKKRGKQMKKDMRKKNNKYKLYMALAAVVALVLLAIWITVGVCGVTFYRCRSNGNQGSNNNQESNDKQE